MTANNPEYRRKLYSKGLCSRHGPGDVTTIAAHPSSASRANRRVVGGRVAALFDEHAAMVLGLCRLLLRDHHEAEDAAQQTFVSAYRALLRGTEPREPGPWLAAIARNECRARLRKRMRAPVPLDGELELELSDSSDDLAELTDRRTELRQLAVEIAKLPSRQREAIALRDFLGLSYEEVATTLKVSVPVVESLLFRARRRLRDTVRTVPRYAAGIVMVPIAMRAAVARDVPDFDAVTVGLGIAGVAGAAAGGVAKLLSVPHRSRLRRRSRSWRRAPWSRRISSRRLPSNARRLVWRPSRARTEMPARRRRRRFPPSRSSMSRRRRKHLRARRLPLRRRPSPPPSL